MKHYLERVLVQAAAVDRNQPLFTVQHLNSETPWNETEVLIRNKES